MKNSQQPASVWSSILKFVAVLFALLFLIGLLFPVSGPECIGRIKITGEIVYDEAQGLFGGDDANTPGEIISLLKEANGDEGTKAILLQVNSPGGSAVASKEIFDEMRGIEKPIVVYMTEAAASGGYYISAPADYIVANPNTITGSIGARATILNYEGLFEKLGLREESIKSGELKDMGAGYRNLSGKEKELLQGLIDETVLIFRKDVEEARKGRLDSRLFNEAMDARILTASQAKRIGLIDEVGGMKAAVRKANLMAGNNETDEEKMLPLCDYNSQGGFDLFTALGSGFGRALAEGLIAKADSDAKMEYRQ